MSLRRENSTLDAECHEKEKLINQLQTRVAVLEQEIKDKDQLVIRTKEVLDATQEQKVRVSESLFLKLCRTLLTEVSRFLDNQTTGAARKLTNVVKDAELWHPKSTGFSLMKAAPVAVFCGTACKSG